MLDRRRVRDEPSSMPGAAGRLPCLDGLRAVSIGLVFWCHMAPTIAGRLHPFLLRLAREAEIGVDVFFVISGLLITLLLLREQDRTGSISLRRFFARRALRLLPAYAAYLLFVAALSALGLASVRPDDWLAACTYMMDAITLLGRDPAWAFAHLWSLSVEEHFYLAWPVALAWLGRRRAAAALMVVLALVPTLRLVEVRLLPVAVQFGLLKFSTPTRLDPVGFGCLLGFLLHDPTGWRQSTSRSGADRVRRAAFWALIGSCVAYSALGWLEVIVKPTLKSAAIAWLVYLCVTRPGSRVGRLLNARPMVAVGVLSYSLYLWQQPFFNARSGLAICRWPASLVLAVVAASASYRWIEGPFLRLKGRVGTGQGGIPRPHVMEASGVGRS